MAEMDYFYNGALQTSATQHFVVYRIEFTVIHSREVISFQNFGQLVTIASQSPL
jgi:hypothetical protein